MIVPAYGDTSLVDPATNIVAFPIPEFAPECGQSRHVGDEPATYWCDAHGCKEILLCATCLAKLEKAHDHIARREGHVVCGYCPRTAPRWRDLVRIVPIGGA